MCRSDVPSLGSKDSMNNRGIWWKVTLQISYKLKSMIYIKINMPYKELYEKPSYLITRAELFYILWMEKQYILLKSNGKNREWRIRVLFFTILNKDFSCSSFKIIFSVTLEPHKFYHVRKNNWCLINLLTGYLVLMF